MSEYDVIPTADEGKSVAPERSEQPDPDPVAASELAGALEAILLVIDSPASVETLAAVLDVPAPDVAAQLEVMAAQLTERNSGIDLRHNADGWRFYTRDQYAPLVERFVLDGTHAKLSKAALETLAVVAYRQPVTRSRISAVRGVNVDGVVRTLVSRGLIQEDGSDSDTGGILYSTTELFLERLGLVSLEDLPSLGPLLPDVDMVDDDEYA